MIYSRNICEVFNEYYTIVLYYCNKVYTSVTEEYQKHNNDAYMYQTFARHICFSEN